MKNQPGSEIAPPESDSQGGAVAFPQLARLLRGLMEAMIGVPPEFKNRFADESLCRRCGRCCYCGVKVQGRMVALKDLPCKHLDYLPDGRAACQVYPLREKTGWCHPISVESVRKELYPADCPYLEGLAGYRGKTDLSAEEFESLTPVLRKIFKRRPKPEYVRARDWERFIRDTLGLPEGG